jgi:hypothetical protein
MCVGSLGISRRSLGVTARKGTALARRKFTAVACRINRERLGVRVVAKTMLLRLEQVIVSIGESGQGDENRTSKGYGTRFHRDTPLVSANLLPASGTALRT